MKCFAKRLLASALLLVAVPAMATTTTNTFQVSATVANSCSVSANDLAFGSVDPLSSTATTGTTTIAVTCSNGTSYDVGIGAGGASGATTTSRAMTDTGSDLLSYALYSDSAMSTNWGDTVGTDTVAGTGSGSSQSLTVYGKIPTGQNTVPAGSYSDTLTVTVSY